jgi:hypothetical protein
MNQGPGGPGDPRQSPKYCTQIVRPQKTTQESKVACKKKEPLFGLKLGLSNLTDTADLHREPQAPPWQGFYWGRAGGRISHPGGEQIGCYSGKGVLAYWDWFLLQLCPGHEECGQSYSLFGHLEQRPALLNYDWTRAEMVHSRREFIPRLWCIPGMRSCSGQF